MKKITAIITSVICLIVSACGTSQVATKRTLLKEYALCKCINYALPSDSSIKKDLSASVYREIILDYEDNYDKIDSLAKKAAGAIKPSIIPDHQGRKAVIMNCMNFYKSKTLDSLIRTMKIQRTKWQ